MEHLPFHCYRMLNGSRFYAKCLDTQEVSPDKLPVDLCAMEMRL